MRSLILASAAFAICVLASETAQAESLQPCDACDSCDSHGHKLFGCRGGHGGHRHALEGRDPSFNCGCNGSYKYPVPPLATYHWPGMYSHQLMTDYHSPWRFPPIKPYVDEEPETELAAVPAIEIVSQRRPQPVLKSVLRKTTR